MDKINTLYQVAITNKNIVNYEKLEAYIRFCVENHNEYETYYEAHHILPKSIYPNEERSKQNISNLSFANHLKAHYLLCDVYKGRENYKILNAVVTICFASPKRMTLKQLKEFHSSMNLDEYTLLVEEVKAKRREMPLPPEIQNKMNISRAKRTPEQKLETQRKRRETLKKKKENGYTHPSFSNETKKKMSNSAKGKILSEETIEKIRISNTGRLHSEETKKKMSEAQYKRHNENPFSNETKKKMSESAKGKVVTEETKKKMSESAKNRPSISEATRNKMKESRKKQPPMSEEHKKAFSRKGYKHSEETKKKISEASKKQTHSEETKKKMSESAKKWREERRKENAGKPPKPLSEETKVKRQATRDRKRALGIPLRKDSPKK